MKTKKIIKALKYFKKYCKKQELCRDCVFYGIGFCGASPNQWEIKEIKEKLKDIETL